MRRLLPLLLLLALAGCGGTSSTSPSPSAGQTSAPVSTPAQTPGSASGSASGSTSPPTASSTADATPVRRTAPPAWLGTRVLPTTSAGFGVVRPTPPELQHRSWTLPDTLPMLPGQGFQATVERAPAEVIARSTWVAACPVTSSDLDWIRLTFWGFDGARHTGELLVNHSASADMVTVFKRLYAVKWPFEQMHITTKAEASAPPTGDGNNTSVFNCRPVRGQTSGFSQHAYGLAIDVDPFQNPYVKGDLVLPELASWYVDRDRRAPGIITASGPVVRAFAAVGWGWGGSWHGLKDYEHFSANGR